MGCCNSCGNRACSCTNRGRRGPTGAAGATGATGGAGSGLSLKYSGNLADAAGGDAFTFLADDATSNGAPHAPNTTRIRTFLPRTATLDTVSLFLEQAVVSEDDSYEVFIFQYSPANSATQTTIFNTTFNNINAPSGGERRVTGIGAVVPDTDAIAILVTSENGSVGGAPLTLVCGFL